MEIYAIGQHLPSEQCRRARPQDQYSILLDEKKQKRTHSACPRAKASPIGGAIGEEGNFPVCQGLPSIGEVARRRRDGEVIPACGSRSGRPSYNLSVSLSLASSPKGRALAPLSFVQIHRKLCRKGAVCGQNAKKSLSLLQNGAKRAIL